jgi:hypothetical protein
LFDSYSTSENKSDIILFKSFNSLD